MAHSRMRVCQCLRPGRHADGIGQFTNTGTVAIGAGGQISLSGSYLQDGGSTAVDGLLSATETDVNGGVLTARVKSADC